ncbi:MAG: phosphodiester glycosidase family protein [Flaviflexus sp.]|uniref:phosphodiester glycosidase family protein n=1 Tax=Flaviflexus sp. TaxID=1969482 RepID=UPI00352F211B
MRADYLYPGTVSDAEAVSDMIEEADAIAGVNGSFFDINGSKAPEGVGISEEDGIVTVPVGTGSGQIVSGHVPVVFGEDGLGKFAGVKLTTSVTVNGQPTDIPVDGVNSWTLNAGNIGLYNHLWGDYTREHVLAGGTGTEVIIDPNGRVTSVGIPTVGQLPEGAQSLVERDGGAGRLAEINVGDIVEIETSVTSDGQEISAAIESNARVVNNGQPVTSRDTTVHPRTAIGFNETGSIMYLVVVDGRQATSTGVSLTDLGILMHELGAYSAGNLDGGGSTTMGAVAPGESEATTPHNPSDGYERPVPNGIGLFVERGSGEVTGYSVSSLLQVGQPERVFPGLTRQVQAKGYDETGSAVPGTVPSWSSNGNVTVTSNGDHTATITGVTKGKDTVTASQGSATGSYNVEVLGELDRIEISPSVVQLSSADEVASFTVYGYDANGYRAPIDANDVTLEGDEENNFSIEPGTNGTFAVSVNNDNSAAQMTVSVGELSADMAITVGVDSIQIADFSDGASWTAAQDRAAGVTVTPAEGYEGGDGVEIDFDFTQSAGTRGAYAVAPNSGFEIPGQPTALTAWVNGNPNGAWPRIQVRQANGTTTQLDGPSEPFEGWRQITFAIPNGVQYPLTFQRFRIMETRPSAQYTGSMIVSDIQALVPTSVDLPQAPEVTDDVIVETGATDESPLRIAVVSDAQFVARDPNSGGVRGAREAFREVLAEDPDLLIINGDFVDEASPADFELAKQIIAEELGDFPYIYVPGNHEIMGGDIQNFIDAFGTTNGYMDVDGTRLIWVNSAPGGISHDFAQLQMLKNALEDAKTNDEVTGVLVFQHHPVDDPLPTKASQLSNRLDAEMLRDWIEDFRETGKPIANIAAGVGIFHAMTLDGIPYFINGNAGKSPTGGSSGSFTGWTMIGVDPAQASSENPRDWVSFEVNTRVDADGLSLGEVPASLDESGEAIVLEPTMVQDDGVRTMAVAWPMSYAWSGTNVHVGSIETAPEGSVAAFDPETNTLTPLAGGEASLTLAVNDKTVTADFTVIPDIVEVAPEGPVFVNNTITIPVVEGVEYLIDGEVVEAGDHAIEVDAVVTARAVEGYVLVENAVVEWSFQYIAPIVEVTPEAPVFVNNTITIPVVEGVQYLIGDEVVTGDVVITEDTTVTAEATDGYVLAEGAETEWSFTYVAPTPAPTSGNLFYFANSWAQHTEDQRIAFGRYGDELIVGDWDGDGADSIAVRRGNQFFVNNTIQGGNAETSFRFGRAGDNVIAGDWDGDGADSFGVRRGTEFFLSNELVGGQSEISFHYGRAGDDVHVGDWDGNGTDTLMVQRGQVFHPSNSLRGGNADSTFLYGRSGDQVLAGDFDGDGVDTLALRRGNEFHVKNSLVGGNADTVIRYGRASDDVYVGDWDGDGVDTPVVNRYVN